MAEQKTSIYCKCCNAQRLATRPGVNHVLHVILSICTFGLWIIVWALLSTPKVGGWRCAVCGTETPKGFDAIVESGGNAIGAAVSKGWRKYVSRAPAAPAAGSGNPDPV